MEDFMELNNNITVKMFGGFSISYCNPEGITKTIDDKMISSVKMWSMLSYLIVNRKRLITSEEIIEAIWNNKEISDPSNTLKTLLFKIRKIFSKIGIEEPKKIITFSRGTFIWTKYIDIVTDVDQLETLCNKSMDKNEEVCKQDLYKAIEILKGDFMPQCLSQAWAASLNLYYHSKFIKLNKKVISELIDKQQNYEEAITICEKSLSIEPYNEMLHRLLIISLLKIGEVFRAKEYYKYFEKISIEYLGAKPTKLITDLYPLIQNASQTKPKEPTKKKNNLERKASQGAFYCEYTTFKTICTVMKRSRESNDSFRLGTIFINNYDKLKKNMNKYNSDIENLIQYISHSLRADDIFTMSNKDKLLILIKNINDANFEKVMKRLLLNYKKTYPSTKIKLSFEKADEKLVI